MRHWTDRGFALITCAIPEGVLPCPHTDIECFTRTLNDGSHLLITAADAAGNSYGRSPSKIVEHVMVAHVRDVTTFTPIGHPGQGFPVFPNSHTALHAALGIAFATIVKEWLSESDWRAMLLQNANMEAHNAGCCASHDHCDPNQAMLDALEEFRYRDPLGEKASDISTQAWNYAKRTYFTAENGENANDPRAVRPLAPRSPQALYDTGLDTEQNHVALINDLAGALDDLKALFEAIDDDRHLQESDEWKRATRVLEQHRTFLNATGTR